MPNAYENGMNVRRHLLLLALLLPGTIASAQARNAAYVEIGGNGIVPTVNYERRFTERVAGRIGFAFIASMESDGDRDTTFAVPLVVNYISHPQRNHHFETGAGLLFVVGDAQEFAPGDDDEEISNLALTGLIGYRYQKPARGFVFRAGITPFFYDGDFAPWAGISFGYGW